MKITPIKTEKIVPNKSNLFDILDKYVVSFKEKSILVITSKIISICQGRVEKIGNDLLKKKKHRLMVNEADYYLPPEENKYGMTITIKDSVLLPSSGIDESNGEGIYIFWPRDKQKVANSVCSYLRKRFKLKYVGVVITDSKTTPLRWGTTGVGISHSGFLALNNYIGKPDIFGRKLKVTKANVLDGLAAAAVLVIGEGNEQTPLAIVEELPFVQFQTRNPTRSELENFKISIDDDIYSSLLKAVNWRKGRNHANE